MDFSRPPKLQNRHILGQYLYGNFTLEEWQDKSHALKQTNQLVTSFFF